MPALWPAFQAQMNTWFCGDAEGGETTTNGSKTAAEIASAYETAIATAGVTVPGNMVASGWVKSTMQTGFETSFAQQMQAAGTPPEGIDIGVPVWIAAATGTVNAWAAVQYQAMPAIGHGLATIPLTGGPTDCLQLDPGLGAIPGLASDINDAFHSESCSLVASVLVAGFTKHLTMISGLYSGQMPNPAGTPPLIPQPPVPWMGVS
jgi:hypothetical protein